MSLFFSEILKTGFVTMRPIIEWPFYSPTLHVILVASQCVTSQGMSPNVTVISSHLSPNRSPSSVISSPSTPNPN